MHYKTRYRLDSSGSGTHSGSIMELSPPASDGEEEPDQQKFQMTPFAKVGAGLN